MFDSVAKGYCTPKISYWLRTGIIPSSSQLELPCLLLRTDYLCGEIEARLICIALIRVFQVNSCNR